VPLIISPKPAAIRNKVPLFLTTSSYRQGLIHLLLQKEVRMKKLVMIIYIELDYKSDLL